MSRETLRGFWRHLIQTGFEPGTFLSLDIREGPFQAEDLRLEVVVRLNLVVQSLGRRLQLGGLEQVCIKFEAIWPKKPNALFYRNELELQF